MAPTAWGEAQYGGQAAHDVIKLEEVVRLVMGEHGLDSLCRPETPRAILNNDFVLLVVVRAYTARWVRAELLDEPHIDCFSVTHNSSISDIGWRPAPCQCPCLVC